MQNRLLVAIGVLGLLAGIAQGDLKWLTDYEEGKKEAAESGKKMLVYFTGSDWAPLSIKLKKEVFSQEAFEVAADQYVLVELDFPKAEGLIEPEVLAKNEEFAQGVGVQQFPTIVLFDSKGRAFTGTGYQAGGPEAYLAYLKEISKAHDDLQVAEGEARKEALEAFLRTLPGEAVEENFSAELDELKKLDPEDETGFVGELAAAKATAEFEEGLEESLMAGDFDGALKQVDAFLAEHNPQGDERQHVLMGRVMVYVEQGETGKAFAELDEMAKLAPESELAQNIGQIKESITKQLEERARMEKEAQEEPAEAEKPKETSVIEEAEAAEKEEAPTVESKPVIE